MFLLLLFPVEDASCLPFWWFFFSFRDAVFRCRSCAPIDGKQLNEECGFQDLGLEAAGWYVAAELATDIIVSVGDVKFHLHKFPLLSKSPRLQKLVATTSEGNDDEIHIPDIPGGPPAFEICAKFCYGMSVTLNAYNVVAARCAAEYLEMHETVEKGNLIYKIEVFLNSGIFRSWKDSIIVLQTTKPLLQWCEDLKVVGRCIDAISSKACIDTSKVDWSYTYNRIKLPSEKGIEQQWDEVKKQPLVPKDWWVEDLCELKINFYKRVIMAVKTKDRMSNEVIGEALQAYALRWVPGIGKGTIQGGDITKSRLLVETIVWLLPVEKCSLPCSFLLKLLKAASLLDSSEMVKKELVKRIGQHLEEALVTDLLIPAPSQECAMYDVDMVQSMVEEFVMQDQSDQTGPMVGGEQHEIRSVPFVSDTSKLAVAKLVDAYLAEISRDPNLPLSKFVDLAEMVGGDSRPVHDGLYRAIDMYLKEHPGLSKAEKRRICRLMDCQKLSMDACMHVAQNERLPLRVVVQVLFFEQVRAATASTGSRADLPMSIRAVPPTENGESRGSSRSATTNTEDDWEATTAELKTLKGELASIRLAGEKNDSDVTKSSGGKVSGKVKGVGVFKPKKILNKIWSNKPGQGDNSGSDTSDSPGSGSANQEEIKATPSRNRRYSVS
ncbi:BTB/POZ domain-containing protein NPY2-like isoform X1 [Magnolia sinica]|uniref:BTB/POZ domain-containing protein NPY2-like isoform X1 n=1 Tax=Magnolia sinica TaxID=86752 RepID=UPI00265A0B56|nr:BTB/POZ domain-containing protein NPY2-like isoform X1 [Magnolia sinica]